jgi:hypothetical protein
MGDVVFTVCSPNNMPGGSISEVFTSQGFFRVLRVSAKSVCVAGEIDHGFA